MKEVPLTQSAYTMPSVRLMGPDAIEQLCHRPINRLYEPYTIVETLTRVFYRNFEDDLKEVIKRNPRVIMGGSEEWVLSRCGVHDVTVIRPESIPLGRGICQLGEAEQNPPGRWDVLPSA